MASEPFELFGIRLVGINAESGRKLLLAAAVLVMTLVSLWFDASVAAHDGARPRHGGARDLLEGLERLDVTASRLSASGPGAR